MQYRVQPSLFRGITVQARAMEGGLWVRLTADEVRDEIRHDTESGKWLKKQGA